MQRLIDAMIRQAEIALHGSFGWVEMPPSTEDKAKGFDGNNMFLHGREMLAVVKHRPETSLRAEAWHFEICGNRDNGVSHSLPWLMDYIEGLAVEG